MSFKRPHISRAVLALALSTAASLTAISQEQSSASVPDLSGVWGRRASPAREGELPFRPWAREIFDEVANRAPDQPFVDNRSLCLPGGGVDAMFPPYLIRFVQTPSRLFILIEFNNQVRTVFLDAEHPADLKPTWYGHSVGRWEDDTLMVETIGFNERTALSTMLGDEGMVNIAHTDSLRVVEHMSLSEDGMTLTDRMTINDPEAFTEPWSFELVYRRLDDAQLQEFTCADDPMRLDLEGLITVGPNGNKLVDLEKLAPGE